MVSSKILYGLKRLVLVGCCFMLLACGSYRTFQIEVLEPSLVDVNEGSKIAVFDNNVRLLGDNIYQSKELRNTVAYFIDSLVITFYNGFWETCLNEENKDNILFLKQNKASYGSDKDSILLLTLSDREKMMEHYDIDFLVALDYCDFEIKQETFHSYFAISVYERGVDTAKFSFDFVVLSAGGVDLLESIWLNGQNLAYFFIPQWKQQSRRIYNSGQVLKLGDYYYKDEHIDQALAIWSAANQSYKQQLQAQMNIAWVYENQGMFDQALVVLEGAKALAEEHRLNNKDVIYLNSYIEIIRKRLEDAGKFENYWIEK